jgi:hypothetical protein
MPTAELLLAQQGPSALAAALGHLSGFSQPPSARSLITHEEVCFGLLSTRVFLGYMCTSEFYYQGCNARGLMG